ncbi:MAG: helix-turn-helix domain-containing protein [Pirellula sp.]|jgi:excisionase family DNA binding protein|nr:helix-turn-helix domain-containing protein [Pirellula sp.]
MTKNEIERWMSSKEAATRMGISPSTFKRLCDANDIPVIRTPGGHRRIDSSQFEVVSRLMQRKGHGTENSIITPEEVFSLLLEADPFPLIERFYRAAPTIQRQIELIEDVFVPALWHIGDQWQRSVISVSQEKICTSTASMVLDGLTARFSTSTNRERTFVGASFASSHDTLASKIVALGLMSIDVRPIFLGCGIAPEYIAECAALSNAEAVWISHTHVLDLDQVVRDHKVLRELLPSRIRVIIGGGGLSPSARRLMDDCTYHESILAWLEQENSLRVS